MSRSIHTTRRDLERRKKFREEETPLRRLELEELREDLQRKRQIKSEIRAERITPRPTDLANVDPASVPIRFLDEGPSVCHAVSEADLRAVLSRLPPGVLSGLVGLTVSLGMEVQQEEVAPDESEPDCDPWIGRVGYQELPGIWEGRMQGIYRLETGQIELYTYVVDPDLTDRPMWELVLRLWVLSTLMCEVAYHDDANRRAGRGRWSPASVEQSDRHAENLQSSWTKEIVAPFLEEAYPGEVARLQSWLVDHGGLSLSLAQLGDPKKNPRAPLFYLAEDVRNGVDPVTARIEFARWLRYRDYSTEAQCILAAIQAEQPQHPDAQILEAEICVDQQNYRVAESLAREVIARQHAQLRAWRVLAEAYEGLALWDLVLETAQRGTEEAGEDSYEQRSFLVHRVRALLELGRFDEMQPDLTRLSNARSVGYRRACELRALMHLHRGEPNEALAIVEQARSTWPYRLPVILMAVRFEASACLGRPLPIKELPPEDLTALRRLRFHRWVDRLIRDYGLREK